MKLKSKRRLASKILKVGESRILIAPDRVEDVDAAISREEIRRLVHEDAIKIRPERGISRSRARLLHAKKKKGRHKGEGHRKGTHTAGLSSKERWMMRVRSLRRKLKSLRDNKAITTDTYRKLYGMIKGGAFEDSSHLEEHAKTTKTYKRR
jgi:large subunit ribosomal protein L19e